MVLHGDDERIVGVLTARTASVQETAPESPLPPQRSDSSYIPNTTASRSDTTSGTAGDPSVWRADPEEDHQQHHSDITQIIKLHIRLSCLRENAPPLHLVPGYLNFPIFIEHTGY